MMLRANASEVNALREVVRCCNEDGGGYVIAEPTRWPGLYVIWQWQDGDEDWTRVWTVWEGSSRVDWRGVDWTRTSAYLKIDGDMILAPDCPVVA